MHSSDKYQIPDSSYPWGIAESNRIGAEYPEHCVFYYLSWAVGTSGSL